MSNGKNILILGATSDMAQATARKFAAEGWNLTLAARNKALLEELAGDVKVRTKAHVTTHIFDALEYANHPSFYASLQERPDVVICFLGYMGDPMKARSDFDEVNQTIDVNLKGPISILNLVANEFEERGSGLIIGVSSVAGGRGRQSNYIYGCAKAGFSTYLSGLRNRFGRTDVHVMAVKPGFVRTKMTEHMELPEKLTAEPEQVAEAIYRAMGKKRCVLYVLGIWRSIMLFVKHIPEPIFKRMNL